MIWYILGIAFFILFIFVMKDTGLFFFRDILFPFIILVIIIPTFFGGLIGSIAYSTPKAENRNFKTETYTLEELDKDVYIWYNRNDEVFYYTKNTGLICERNGRNKYELTESKPYLMKITWTTFKARTAPWWFASSIGNTIKENVFYLNSLTKIIL